MHWWQKSSAVGDSPSLSLSFSDDIYCKSSSIFPSRAWSFKSQDCRLTTHAKKQRPLSVNETLRSSDVVISMNKLRRSRSNGNSMAPQPLPLPELATLLRQEAAHPSNTTASVRLPSPPASKSREERDKSCDAPRRDGHANGDALTLTSAISSKIASQGARRNTEHAETLASRRSPGRPYGADMTRNYKLNVPISIPVSSFSSPSLSPGKNVTDTFPSHHLSPSAFQNWSAPELHSPDMILGHAHSYQPYEKTVINADNSPLHNQKMNFGHNAISPHGAVSPLHRISADASTTRRDSSNQTNVHPLPLPPTASTASQPAPSPKVAAKQETGKSHWKKGKLIGRGTFGSVYVGSDRETGALCAMKEVELVPDDQKSAECIRQLEQEIQVLHQLKHPNIVQYYGW